MNSYKHILYLFILTVFVSCDKETEMPEVEKLDYKVNWSVEFEGSTKSSFFVKNGVLRDDVFIHAVAYNDQDRDKAIQCRNKLTGELLWEYIVPESKGQYISGFLPYESDLIIYAWSSIFYLDLDDFSIRWESDFKDLSTLPSHHLLHNDMLYFSSIESDVAAKVVQVNPRNGEKTTMAFHDFEDRRISRISPPAISVNQKGNNVLLYNLFPYRDKVNAWNYDQELVAYDLTLDSLLWKKEFALDSMPSNVGIPPAVFENQVIVGNGKTLYSFDINSGEDVWHKTLDSNLEIMDDKNNLPGIFNITEFLIENDRLYISPVSHELFCLDPRTGELIWTNEIGNKLSCFEMLYIEDKDYIVLSSGHWYYDENVHVINALDGRTVTRIFEHGSYKSLAYDRDSENYYHIFEDSILSFKLDI